jgi:hypothetical protein
MSLLILYIVCLFALWSLGLYKIEKNCIDLLTRSMVFGIGFGTRPQFLGLYKYRAETKEVQKWTGI